MHQNLSPMPYLDQLRADWSELTAYRNGTRQPLIDGESLSLAAVIAISRFRVVPTLANNPEVLDRVRASAEFASDFVKNAAAGGVSGVGGANTKTSTTSTADGDVFNPIIPLQPVQTQTQSMYGVTTGFGGSANTRPLPSTAVALQQVLIKGLQAGIIPSNDVGAGYATTIDEGQDLNTLGNEKLLMPEAWVKGAVAVRLNSLIRGYSGCRYDVLIALHKLLEKNIVPCVPLRMSISASGDLGPLAYIAAAVTGEGKAKVWCGEGPSRVPLPAPLALTNNKLPSMPLLPKEGLAIVNGTAPSCAVAVSGIWDGGWALLGSVALTALALEALHGTMESFVPFLHDIVRPHPGQIEVAAAVRNALQGSKLVTTGWEEESVGVTAEERLRQDRYSLRTSPQWLGPQIEEALAAHRTITVEINATTDNPIIDARDEKERSANEKWNGNLCGGNFQGTSITVAMEKMRVGLQHAGRIAYAQMVELGQPSMNRGLPPDLAANEPSLDYGQKALDIATASYLAELSFISNTVSNHVQPAEMHNQSLNSLALVSARYTVDAVQLVQMIHANLLISLCQAIDIRAMYADFFVLMKKDIESAVEKFIEPKLEVEAKTGLVNMLYQRACVSFALTSTLDTPERFPALVRPLIADIFTYISVLPTSFSFSASNFHAALASTLATSFLTNRGRYFLLPPGAAAGLLGDGTRHLYLWVRETLGIPMRVGLQGAAAFGIQGDSDETDVSVSRVYKGIVKGEVNSVLLHALSGGR